MFQNEDAVRNFLAHSIQGLRLIVLGDVMLDKYYYGEVSRISPEAPVPVNRVKEEKEMLGGAANVAANLARLGADVFLVGVSGQDENRERLLKLLQQERINSSGLLITKRKTTTKLRILGAHQQMLRLDFEDAGNLSVEEEQRVITWLQQEIETGKVNGIILSDYAKGVCTPSVCQYLVKTCQEKGIPCLVDPKGLNWDKYKGAAYVTPNVKELGEAVAANVPNEDQSVQQAAKLIQSRYQMGSVLATRSEKGMSLLAYDELTHIPTHTREVYDVSGAGDTVAAVFLAAIAGGLSKIDAANLANIAAGIVVGKVGTYPINKQELLSAVGRKKVLSSQKFCDSWDELMDKVDCWRQKGEKIVFTNGCFDILHRGHVTYLQKAKQLGQRLIIGLNSDASVSGLKGPSRPIVAEQDRAFMLTALECVDAVVLFSEATPALLIQKVCPDILVKGGDYCPDEVVGRDYAGKVEIISFEEGYSTTNIIEKIMQKGSEA